jgi:ATP-dependent DNA ligase
MPLGRTCDPFCHPEWLFEVKWDGFRSLAYVDKGNCRLISRNGNQFKSFPALADSLQNPTWCGIPRLSFADASFELAN